MGIVYADKRASGNWYISVAGSEAVTNFSLRAELVESPVIDQFIPLDGDKAAAERCGRFCVVLEQDEDDVDDEDDFFARSGATRSARNLHAHAPPAWSLAVTLLAALAPVWQRRAAPG